MCPFHLAQINPSVIPLVKYFISVYIKVPEYHILANIFQGWVKIMATDIIGLLCFMKWVRLTVT